MQIASVGTAFPPYRYSQSEVSQALLAHWEGKLPEPAFSPVSTPIAA